MLEVGEETNVYKSATTHMPYSHGQVAERSPLKNASSKPSQIVPTSTVTSQPTASYSPPFPLIIPAEFPCISRPLLLNMKQIFPSTTKTQEHEFTSKV